MASAITTTLIGSAAPVTRENSSKKANAGLWIVQGLLAALFLLTGGMKLLAPLAVLEQQAHMPGLFLRFIGVCEILGALGLILPGLTRIRTTLTPLAAAGLVIIMIGATVVTIATVGVAMAILPYVVGLFSTVVAVGRWRVAPLRTRVHA